MKIINLILILFASTTFGIYGQNVKVFADTDSVEYIVGDYINYSLEVTYPKGVSVSIPAVKDSIKNLDFIKQEDPIIQESDTEVYELHKFVFSRYDSNDVIIPAYNIAYTTDGTNIQYVRVNQVNILVRTIEVDANADIQDVKDPIRIPLDWFLILIVSLILFVMAGICVCV